MNAMGDVFAVFETPSGQGGSSWNDRGVSGIQMPEPEAASIRTRLQRRFPQAHESFPPPDIQQAINKMTALLRGESPDLSFIQLDLHNVPALDRQGYEVARTIVAGETLPYGRIATRFGD